jgi:hypothetical protein
MGIDGSVSRRYVGTLPATGQLGPPGRAGGAGGIGGEEPRRPWRYTLYVGRALKRLTAQTWCSS